MKMNSNIVMATKALLRGALAEDSLGGDVALAVRGFRGGLMPADELLACVARSYRASATRPRFDARGNLVNL
ncbi:MAG: hypothetical protein HOH65_22570 [Rhodospirillaceae bacterium]|nr:hypothetical protein [Rhodospirillaceae bacterium]